MPIVPSVPSTVSVIPIFIIVSYTETGIAFHQLRGRLRARCAAASSEDWPQYDASAALAATISTAMARLRMRSMSVELSAGLCFV